MLSNRAVGSCIGAGIPVGSRLGRFSGISNVIVWIRLVSLHRVGNPQGVNLKGLIGAHSLGPYKALKAYWVLGSHKAFKVYLCELPPLLPWRPRHRRNRQGWWGPDRLPPFKI